MEFDEHESGIPVQRTVAMVAYAMAMATIVTMARNLCRPKQ